MLILPSNGSGATAYNIQQSVRLRSSASAYLNRTVGTPTNNKIFTVSFWVKRGSLGSRQGLIGATNAGASFYWMVEFDAGNNLTIYDAYATGTTALTTTQVFRDPSAWYHIVVAVDTTQATASNRTKVYVNGSQVTSFSVTNYPTQNSNTYFNASGSVASVGSWNPFSTPYYFDGYLTEVNFIDGQALTPSSFGETDTTTGAWKPKAYSGSRGTNGFYLEFKTSVSENLVAHYTGTISGSSVLNVAGSTNGTKGSGASSTTGKVGDGFQFDGTINGYIDTGIATNYNSAFSVSAWFNTTTTSTSFLVSKGSYYANSTSDFPFHLSLNTNGSVSAALDSGNGDYSTDLFLTSSTTGYNDGNWHHVAFSFTSTTAKIYVDGVERASAATGFSVSSTSWNWFLGRTPYPQGGGSPGNPYNGKMDDFRLYSRAITAAEVTTLYTGGGAPAAIGYDASGNNNHWNPNNISLTPGVTYDSMTDVPTLTSATAANFAVLNPLDKYSSITVSGGNLNAICADVAWRSGAMTFGNFTTGKWYYEVTANSIGGSTYISAGWELTSLNHTAQSGGVGAASGNNFGVYINSNSRVTKVNGSTFSSDSNTNSNGDVLMFAVDFDAGKGWIGKNGTWYDSGNPSAGTSPCTTTVSGGMTPAYEIYNNGDLSFNAGQRPFTYTPPTGFKSLNTYNLPDPTIARGNKHFDISLYTGNGSNQSVTNSGGFSPGVVWMKDRSAAYNHALYDVVRGTGRFAPLYPNLIDTEGAYSNNFNLSSFDSSGFSIGTVLGTSSINANGNAIVAWQWNAGATTVTNTAGSISAQVRANPSAGISVVTYTGTGANATVGHGLGVAPSMIISKSRNNADSDAGFWDIYHAGLDSAAYFLRLNTSDSQVYAPTVWNSTVPTSSVYSVGTASGVNAGTGSNYVAYCFAAIPGYSAFGRYSGNGSSNGAFVYTGFRPRFVMVKRIEASGSSWVLWDSARGAYNLNNADLYPDLNIAEYASPTDCIDMLSNGFKQRGTGTGSNNAGSTYVYAAFAENPFKYSLAR